MDNKIPLVTLAVVILSLVIGESIIAHNSNNELRTQINDLNLRLDALESANNSGSKAVNLTNINTRLDVLENNNKVIGEELTIFGSLDSRVAALESDIAASNSNADLDDLYSRVESLESDVYLLGREIDILSQGDGGQVIISDNSTDAEYAAIDHTHSQYSLTNHTHDEYSLVNHTHYYSEIQDLELFVGTSIQLVFEPDYTSQWITLQKGSNLIEHNLGTRDLIVYILGKDHNGNTHQMYYGVDWDTIYTPEHDRYEVGMVGVYWISNDNSISIVRGDQDAYWEQAKVLIWKIPSSNRVPATR